MAPILAATDTLCERLKSLGYAPNLQLKLCGQIFELTSDPIIFSEKLVFSEGVERRSGKQTRIRIPLSMLLMAQDKVG